MLNKIYLFATIIFIGVIAFMYNNCNSQPFTSKDNLAMNAYAGLSPQDALAMKTAETSLQKADVNIHKFLNILDSFDEFVKKVTSDNKFDSLISPTSTSKTDLSEAEASLQIERVQYTTEIMGSFLNILNTLPTLTQSQQTDFEIGLSALRSLQQPRPDDLIVKSFALLIEIKILTINYIRQNQANVTETELQKNERSKNYLTNISSILTEVVAALIVSRPSSKSYLSKFKESFLVMLTMATSPASTQTSATTTNGAAFELGNLINELEGYLNANPVQ